MPYKVYSPTFDVEGGPKERNCDVRVKARAAKLETTGRGLPRAIVATGVVTFTLTGQPAKTGDTDENGIATALFENVPKQRDESRLRLETVFRSQDGETATADPIRITIPPAPRGRDDRDDKGPRRRLFLEKPGLFTSEGKTFALLDCHLTRKIRDAEGKSKDVGIRNIPVFFKFNGIPHVDDPAKYERTDPTGRVLFYAPVEVKDEEQRGLIQAVAKFGDDDFEYSEIVTLIIPAKGKAKAEHTLKVTGQPMGEEGNFYFLVQAKLEGPSIKDIPVQLYATLYDRAGNPVQIQFAPDLRTDDSGEVMVQTRMLDWQDWVQDIFFGGHTKIGEEEVLSKVDHKKIPKKTKSGPPTHAVNLEIFCDGERVRVIAKDKDNNPCSETIAISPNRPTVEIKDSSGKVVGSSVAVPKEGTTFFFFDDPKPHIDPSKPHDPTPDSIRVMFSSSHTQPQTKIIFPRSK